MNLLEFAISDLEAATLSRSEVKEALFYLNFLRNNTQDTKRHLELLEIKHRLLNRLIQLDQDLVQLDRELINHPYRLLSLPKNLPVLKQHYKLIKLYINKQTNKQTAAVIMV